MGSVRGAGETTCAGSVFVGTTVSATVTVEVVVVVLRRLLDCFGASVVVEFAVS